MNKHKGKLHFCRNCLNSFIDEKVLEKHKEYCFNQEAVRVEMPKKGTTLSFNKHFRKMRVPFVVYADFECFADPIDTCKPSEKKSFTASYQKHTPSGFCYYVKCFEDNIFEPVLVKYTAISADLDVAQKFVESLEKTIKMIYDKFKFTKKVKMSSKERKHFDQSKI